MTEPQINENRPQDRWMIVSIYWGAGGYGRAELRHAIYSQVEAAADQISNEILGQISGMKGEIRQQGITLAMLYGQAPLPTSADEGWPVT